MHQPENKRIWEQSINYFSIPLPKLPSITTDFHILFVKYSIRNNDVDKMIETDTKQ